MKKLMVIFLVAGFMTACNNGTDTTTKTDSAATAIDSSKTIVTDSSSRKVDSAINAVADTAKSKMNNTADSAKKAIKK